MPGSSAASKAPCSPRLNSENGCSDTGNAELSSGVSVPAALAGALRLRRMLSSAAVDVKEIVSNGLEWKPWTAA